MLKTIDTILIALMISAAAWTFKVKYDAEAIEAQVATVERKAQLERETIALLEADWSLLNQPDRLQRLAEAFKGDLALEPVLPQQIVELNEVPEKVAEPASAGNVDLAIKTGSVKSKVR